MTIPYFSGFLLIKKIANISLQKGIIQADKEMKTSVKIELTRSEDFMTSTPAPPCKVRLKMGAKRDGSLCALDATVDVDNGVYAAAWWSSLLALLMASGYRIPNFS